ncbi:BnaCnng55470D [Brassica napus]|uniref:BnaCnng55470D protein n=1 Tax=Brassica napus TaxID=3708 RepID=A0A078JQ94_BRANA|nr:BnaCnng55470D [Brassica napus]
MTPSMASSLSTFLSILLLLSLPLPSTQDLAADKSALLSLRSAGIFGNLTNLRTLSLRLNALTGTLPLDLGACSDLRRLYLQGNRFSGEIPPFLFGLSNLVRLDLGENEFTGEISSGFKNLTRLKTLYLENNKLSGSLLDLGLGLGLDQFNVSNNSLNGSIPKSLQKFDSDSFLGTSLCGKPLGACSDEGTVPSQPISVGNIPGKRKSKLSGGAIAGIVIGCVVGFLLIVLVLMVLFRRKGDERTRAIDVETIKQLEIEVPEEKTAVEANEPSTAAVNSSGARKLVFFGNATKVFELEDLLRASAEVLGKGTFGTAYKAVLDAATLVAVKRLKDVTMADREFKEKIEVVGAMDHENLVPLRAYYCSGDEKLLVYDFMPMGSLSALLHGNKGAGRSPLDWEVRARIALGAARGLDYLHSQDPLSSHGNVKSSNILLTNSHDARVSDFGLAQLVGSSSTTPNRVTGYRAPEVTDPSRVSQKADVYSFGVVLLELLTGKAPSNSVMNEEGMDLARWVHSVEREEWRREVFDSELMSLERVDSVEGEMEEMLQLGIECTEQHPDKRPVMVEVVRRIQELRQPGSELVD